MLQKEAPKKQLKKVQENLHVKALPKKVLPKKVQEKKQLKKAEENLQVKVDPENLQENHLEEEALHGHLLQVVQDQVLLPGLPLLVVAPVLHHPLPLRGVLKQVPLAKAATATVPTMATAAICKNCYIKFESPSLLKGFFIC